MAREAPRKKYSWILEIQKNGLEGSTFFGPYDSAKEAAADGDVAGHPFLVRRMTGSKFLTS